jgi:hypothetical protein
MDNKTEHHICPSCGWGSATVVCKRCSAEYIPPAPVKVENVEQPTKQPSKKDDMSWFVF